MYANDPEHRTRRALHALFRPTILLLLLLVALPRTAAAQRNSVAEIFGHDLENAFKDILHIWTSPARVRGTDILPLIGLTQAVILTGTFDGQIQQWVRDHPESLPVRMVGPMEEPRPLNLFGRSFLLQPLSMAMYVTGHIIESEDLRTAGMGCSTASLSNTLARHVIAQVGGRMRPRYDMGPYDIELLGGSTWEKRSFPNGHGANIMTCVTYWNHRFDLGVAEPLLYVFAIALGSARITAEAHWASDTVFGLVFGYAVGRGVAARFAQRDAADELEELQALQAGTYMRRGVSIGWRIRVH